MARLSAPLDAQIELTRRCNLRCFHCYNFWRYSDCSVQTDDHKECTQSEFYYIVETLYNVGVQQIVLTGGEPILKIDIVLALLNSFVKQGVAFSLNTNGTLITDQIAHNLHKAGLRSALVSVDGTRNIHNAVTGNAQSFDKTLAGITHLVGAKIPTMVNMVVSQRNLHCISEVAEIVHALGVHSFSATPFVPAHPDHLPLMLSLTQYKEALRQLISVNQRLKMSVDVLVPPTRCMFEESEEAEFIRHFGNRKCTAGMTTCTISPEGNVRPCSQADFDYGNMFHENFSEIWERMAVWSSPQILPETCQSCNANIVCGGGCRMAAKFCNGSVTAKDPYATEPINDLNRITKHFQSTHSPIMKFDAADVFIFNPLCRFREESFGGIIILNQGTEWLQKDAFEKMRMLSQEGSFTLQKLQELFTVETEAAIQIVNRLLHNTIISHTKEVKACG